MDKTFVLAALAALGQETRIDIFRALVRSGEGGMCAGEISTHLSARQNTVSTHLAILSRASLIRHQREGRSVRYFADMAGMESLLAFLLEDCCGGKPGTCASALKRTGKPAPHPRAQATTMTDGSRSAQN